MKFQREVGDKSEWPKTLFISKNQETHEDDVFYSWVIQPYQHGALIQILSVVITFAIIISFFFWPKTVQDWAITGIKYICMVLSVIFITKFLLLAVFKVLGIDVRLFPNMFEEVPFYRCLWPILSIKKSAPGKFKVLYQILGSLFMGYLIYLYTLDREEWGETLTDAVELVQEIYHVLSEKPY